ncbi:MAG: dTMP kinase [Betaproteobacteria bacterium HGW-Betaproteobacteria-22]|nr:MAG: dTMP kinase [Betaproteobacteria bacterium HGW-Betaproteobacteria-22]
MTAKFITLEGMDGAGKSTHIPNIIKMLGARGVEVISTREPGGTELGEKLRTLLLHENMHPETETLLMFAARREHIAQVILPALARGAYVLSDRFTDATYAYQAGAKGVAANKVVQLEQWVQEGLQPDVTLLFDVPVEVSVARLSNARTPDKFERESAEFFAKIREAYLLRARENPERFKIINANQPLDKVYKAVEAQIAVL